MSFEKLSNGEQFVNDTKPCVVLVNFDNKELSLLRNVGMLSGIREHIIISGKNGENTIKDILEGNISSTDDVKTNNKAILFNNIPSKKMTGFLESIKKLRMRRPLSAVVTETSINWTLNNLVLNLLEENQALASGKTVDHHDK